MLTGTMARYVLPYNWDWPIALNLGAMLSATDPVAVMAICKSLGVSERLTMLVAGESLLNDGGLPGSFLFSGSVLLEICILCFFKAIFK